MFIRDSAVVKFRKLSDMVGAMSKQIGTMGYAIVLTFFSYNFLSLLTYTNLGTYITYIGAMGLQAVGASNSPILLIIGFILITGFINLFVGGLSSDVYKRQPSQLGRIAQPHKTVISSLWSLK